VRRSSFELEPDEELHAVAHASFRGAAATSARATFALGSARMRQRAYEDWRHAVEAAGFPTAGPEMFLAVTDRRLLVCRTTFVTGRPSAIEGGVELARIFDVAAVRHGLVTSVAFALVNGQIIEVEAVRGARLRRFARSMRDALDRKGD
jgi:hypothetical protein